MTVYVRDSDSSVTSMASCGSRSGSSITNWVKLLTFLLLGFAGGLLYHLVLHQHVVSGQELLLQANDQIVQQLAAENQQHSQELEQLQQKLKQQEETSQRLRKRNQLIESIEDQQAHPERDPHAILWSHEVHDARLEAAHKQAEALLRMRHAQQQQQPQHHDVSEV